MKTDGPHFFFDFDSTIVTKESLDEVIAHALSDSSQKEKLVRQVEEITNLGMEGKILFTESLTRRFEVVSLLRSHFESVGINLLNNITPGMEELFSELHQNKISTYVISGGFYDSIYPVAQKLAVPSSNIFTNTVIFDGNGYVTGIDTNNICFSNDGKAPVITHIVQANNLTGSICMIGDGANDLLAYKMGVADKFCGFTANVEREIMQREAPATASTTEQLRDFIFNNLSV